MEEKLKCPICDKVLTLAEWEEKTNGRLVKCPKCMSRLLQKELTKI